MSESTTNTSALAARELDSMKNSPALLEEHGSINQGCTVTRFPPEPNGYLHIGHAKSMHMNFSLAFDKLNIPQDKRRCIFRYDDTNPEAESQEYIDSLREDVLWMGWSPCKTTFSSEYFQNLYDFAVQLIKNDKAYVCHQTGEEIRKSREIAKAKLDNPNAEGNPNSPWRDRPIEESLQLFDDMRRGKFAENTATLRMKMDMTSTNFNMWDQVAYRIKYVPHPHAGDKWCIYPTYDFTHCIIDSIEHVDYSICTLEFETRRESYYWLLEALEIYRPFVYEFARLNITNTVLSKRRLLKLVNTGRVRGWDDPRMPTIKGLRRRGYTPEAINAFCHDIGVTRNENLIEYERLEYWARSTLHHTSRRVMAVLEPLKVTITNLVVPPSPLDLGPILASASASDSASTATATTAATAPPYSVVGKTAEGAAIELVRMAPNYPPPPPPSPATAATDGAPAAPPPACPNQQGSHPVLLTRTVFIDRCDFRLLDSPNYFGLAPGKVVGLKFAFPIRCNRVLCEGGYIIDCSSGTSGSSGPTILQQQKGSTSPTPVEAGSAGMVDIASLRPIELECTVLQPPPPTPSSSSSSSSSATPPPPPVPPTLQYAKPKSYIQWVSDPEYEIQGQGGGEGGGSSGNGRLSTVVEVRCYEKLFSVPSPDERWEDQINPSSECVYPQALMDGSLLAAAADAGAGAGAGVGGFWCDPSVVPPPEAHVQFERLGFFVLDGDSRPGSLVFNRTVTLKESAEVAAASASAATGAGSGAANGATGGSGGGGGGGGGGAGDGAGRSRKEEQQRQLEAKMARMSLNPVDMFKSMTDKYSQFEADTGIPTHDRGGEPLAKSAYKKLRKEWEKQKKLYEKAQQGK